jgi:hypothetical protein
MKTVHPKTPVRQNSFGPKRAETEFGVVLALFNLQCGTVHRGEKLKLNK